MSNPKKPNPAAMAGIAMSLARRRKQNNEGANGAEAQSEKVDSKAGVTAIAVVVILVVMLVVMLSVGNT